MNRTRDILNLGRVQNATQDEIFKSVCLDVSEQLDSDLVSIWFFDDIQSHIECQANYDAVTGNFSDGQILHQKDYPHYFKTIIEYNSISAPNARTNSATKELSKGYFAPNRILSRLDFILHNEFKPIGVICCENRSYIRDWTEADKSYLRKIATLVSSRFHFCERVTT